MRVGRIFAIGALALIAAACGPRDQSAPAARPDTGAPSVAAPSRYLVAAANPLAADAGAEVLRRGGTAVDAAIAVQAVLGLVEPQSSGFGGGAFLLHYDPATGGLAAYDGRETAPASATPDRFLTADGQPMNFYDAVASGLSVGTPGVVRMLALAHDEHGRLPWPDLLAPARRLATEGFAVSPRLNRLLERTPRLKTFPKAAAYFYDAAGAPRPVGHILKNPEYAETLRTLSESGPDAFYGGRIAEEIVAAANEAPRPGGMTLQDLADYRPVKREAVCGPYRSHRVCSMPPPSSGGVTLLQMLSLLQAFDMAGAGAGSIEALHLLLEASRLAFADRNQYLADQDRAAAEGGLTQAELIDGLLNPDYLAARSRLISRTAAAPRVEAGDPSPFVGTNAQKWRALAPTVSPEPPSTSHFVIIDGAGRIVSMTTTVEFAFGSHIMAAGMILNNQLTDFSFEPERDGRPVANAVAPGKRPRSSMTPAIVFGGDGKPYAALGSPGGPAIIGFVAKTLIGVIDHGLTMQAAIDAPNIVYPRGSPILEANRFDPQIVAGLKRLGHPVTERELDSGVHGFRILPDGSLDGGADPRREGVVRTGFVEVTPAE